MSARQPGAPAQIGDGDNPGIVILTPAYNDWPSVFALLRQLDSLFGEHGLTGNVVIVDDGSPVFADTLDFGELDLSAIGTVEVVTLARNMGNQRAIAIGIGYVAANMRCGNLIVMDSDLEDQPKYIPQLIAESVNSGNEIVFAERTRRSESRSFQAFYWVYKYLYKVLTGMPISIGNFSAIPGQLIKRVASISEIWNHYPAGIMRARVPFRSISATRGTRLHGQSKMNLVSLVIHGLSGLAVHADVVSVRIVLGILMLSIAIIGSIGIIIFQKFFTDIHMIGWSSQIVTILGSIFIQVFIAAIFIVFLVLSGRNNRTVIPAIDYDRYILDSVCVYPVRIKK